MDGKTIGTLNVFSKRDNMDAADPGSMIWSTSGGQLNQWHLGLVAIDESFPFKVSER